jgi:hypothetical protein
MLERFASNQFSGAVKMVRHRAIRQTESLPGRHILIAVARYLAAHFPTERALLQTADIAGRLMRGGELHREAQAAE